MREKWILENKKGDFRAVAAACGVDPLVGKLLVNRGIASPQDAHWYLYGTVADLNDPHLLKDADRAAELILAARERGEKIAVASDYDDDGIFSAYALRLAMDRLGVPCRVFTPDRVQEGYGLNERIVREAGEAGCGLLLTCDNGIAALDAVDAAKAAGMTVVVTDHHEVPYAVLKDGTRQQIRVRADAVVDPKQQDCPYPFDGLCGAGVAFQLIRILYSRAGVPEEEAWDLLPYIAIATVADVMDLTEDNRIIVREGLRRLAKTEHPGLRALLEMQNLAGRELSAYHIGFVIGPCFNAAGRLAGVQDAFAVLDAPSQAEGAERAARLIRINEERKKQTEDGLAKAREIVEKEGLLKDPVLMLILEDCHESLAGLIAGKLREEYHHPSFVFTRTAEGLKGSGRSVEAYPMYDRLTEQKDLLLRFGGHAMAAGLSLLPENYETFRKRMNEACGLTAEDLRPVVRIDSPLPLGYLSETLLSQMELLEPCGKGNRSPLFAGQHFTLERLRRVGRDGSTARLTVRDPDGTAAEAVLFFGAEALCAFLAEEYGAEAVTDAMAGRGWADVALTFVPRINEFMGRRSIELQVKNYCRIR